jgi:hypothetical protein
MTGIAEADGRASQRTEYLPGMLERQPDLQFGWRELEEGALNTVRKSPKPPQLLGVMTRVLVGSWRRQTISRENTAFPLTYSVSLSPHSKNSTQVLIDTLANGCVSYHEAVSVTAADHNYYCKPTESAGDETTAVDHTIPNQPSSPTRTVYPPTRGPSHKRSTRKVTSSGSRLDHIRRQTTLMLTPPKKLAPPPTFFHSIKAILFASCELIFASTIRTSLNRLQG